MFLTNAPAAIERIAGEAEDVSATAFDAHAVKGLCLNVGARRMAELCRRIEAAASQKELHIVRDCLEQLRTAFAETKAQLTSITNRQPASA